MTILSSKVSIILPVYNGAQYIRQSIDSCLDQTFTDFELIIVDDCSTDETPDIIREYQDQRIKYIRNENNQRLPRSLNIGFSHATGDYLTWTSDDNIYLPEAIERMVNVLDDHKYEFVYADILALHDDRKEAAQHEHLQGPGKLNLSNSVRACFLYTRNVMNQVGKYDPDMELIEDYDFWVRVEKKFDMYHIDQPLYYYRYHKQQLYTARNREIKIIEMLFKVKYEFMDRNEVNWFMRNYIIQNSKGFNFVKLLQSKFYYKSRINRFLAEYKSGKQNFKETKAALHKLTDNIRWQLKKKHFIFLRKLPPFECGEWGGLECLMMDWLKRIDYQCCQVTVAVTEGWREKFEEEINGRPVNVVEFPFSFNSKPIVRFKNMLQFLRNLKADTVVFFQAWLWEFRLPEVLAGFFKTGNQAFMHENLGPPAPPSKTSKRHFRIVPGLAIWWHIPWIVTNLRAYVCKNIIVVSREIKDMLTSLWGYPANKVTVCYHGVNINKFCPSKDKRLKIRELLNILPEEKVIIMAARLTAQKRVDRMIEAFDILCRQHSQLKLLIAGDGPLENELRELAKSKACADKIMFLGHVTNVSDYLKASDISVLSSDNEGFGIALVEALATGLICVSTQCPGPSEIIQDGINGFLVEKSVAGVLRSLEKVMSLSDEKRNEISKNARAHAGSYFEINNNIYKAFTKLHLTYLGVL